MQEGGSWQMDAIFKKQGPFKTDIRSSGLSIQSISIFPACSQQCYFESKMLEVEH